MIDHAFSLWNFKPDETAPFPSAFESANKQFIKSFRVLDPQDIEPCLDEFPTIQKNWSRISPWVVRSDLARLLHVYAQGGFYFDSDCEILREFPSIAESAVVFLEAILPTVAMLGPREEKTPERRLRVANYAFGAMVPRHPFFKECLEECTRRLTVLDFTAATPEDVLWVCGPDVITSVFHDNEFAVRLLEFRYLRHLALGAWRNYLSL